jgi:pyridoxine 5-phosphate synthase
MTDVCAQLKASDIVVSLFIDAQKDQIDAAKQCGAPVIELHTGHYADTTGAEPRALAKASLAAKRLAQYAALSPLLANSACSCSDSTRCKQAEFERIKNMATYAHSIGLQVNAGHGLTLENTGAIAQLPEIVELNIGHSIIARAEFGLFVHQ